MAVIIKTRDASQLLQLVRNAIDEGKIETWSYDQAGDFTHTPEQWKYKAWLRPKVYAGELRFGIMGRNDTNLSTYIYGVYHGRFIEMLLNHFDANFSLAQATAQKTEPDIF
jgi:hypothetical protein